MLDDTKKPLKVPYKIPQPKLPSGDIRPSPKTKQSAGHRLASARDRTNAYVQSQSSGLSEAERAAFREELRQRFQPGAGPMPMTISGLASLANERIEDAIARGQFKNIPRGVGKHTERDHNASSAFIDTTEYFMNKIIQRQEIVPPWIEKQQEITRETERFRERLRSDWRRHAARLIASQGGTLEQQKQRARAYAAAEARFQESKRVQASMAKSSDDNNKSFTPISHDGRLSTTNTPSSTQESSRSSGSSESESLPHLPPLRDPEYLSIERSYHELQIKTINDLIRSYNLQAPRLAQRPYLNLERELEACYAAVAPSLAEEIERRATERAKPSRSSVWSSSSGGSSSGVFGGQVKVYDEDSSKGYGFKEFWRDLWGTGERR